jgi:hypothetical protein
MHEAPELRFLCVLIKLMAYTDRGKRYWFKYKLRCENQLSLEHNDVGQFVTFDL